MHVTDAVRVSQLISRRSAIGCFVRVKEFMRGGWNQFMQRFSSITTTSGQTAVAVKVRESAQTSSASIKEIPLDKTCFRRSAAGRSDEIRLHLF
jgi:hypothetical protein